MPTSQPVSASCCGAGGQWLGVKVGPDQGAVGELGWLSPIFGSVPLRNTETHNVEDPVSEWPGSPPTSPFALERFMAY